MGRPARRWHPGLVAKPVVEIEPYTEPTGQVVKLDDWWKEMAAARIESIGKPGLYCDSSPTGAGKSHADRQAMIAASRSWAPSLTSSGTITRARA